MRPLFFLLLMMLTAGACRKANTESTTAAWQDLTPGTWTEVKPGGSTICSNGTPYAFYFLPQNPQKLLVFFQGGGACWNPVNCDLAGKPTYDPTVDTLDNPGHNPAMAARYGWQGIFNLENPDNPFRDYSFLFIPYCTADTHLGDRTATYTAGGRTVTIQHRGYTNVNSALEWVYAKMPAPAEIFVTGESAGSVASPVYAGVIADHYTQTRIVHLGDCSGSYRGENIALTFAEWGVNTVLQKAGLPTETAPDDFTEVIVATARKHPNLVFSQYNSANDEVQRFFLGQLGESPDSMPVFLLENMEMIAGQAPNYRYYIDTGSHHCILSRPEFFVTRGGGQRFREWVAALAEGQSVQSSAEGLGK